MKAIIYEKYGGPEVLQLAELPDPVPADNEILVKQQATVVSSGDLKLRQATPFIVRLFNGLFKPKNNILGSTVAGQVVAVGKSVKHFSPGDPVFGFIGFGAYAELICIPENGAISLLPQNMDYKKAAAIPFGALSANYFLKKSRIQKGQKVLIYGASGSVGTMAVQLAAYLGAHVTAVCSTSNKLLVKSLGAHQVLDYTQDEFPEKEKTYDVVFDTVNKLSYARAKQLIRPYGIFLTTGFSPKLMMQSLLAPLIDKKYLMMGFAKETRQDLLYIKQLVGSFALEPVIEKVYPLEEIAQAHAHAEKGHKKGNLVITFKS